MKRTLKKSLAIILAAATILCCAPLTGLLDFKLPEFANIFADRAEAIEASDLPEDFDLPLYNVKNIFDPERGNGWPFNSFSDDINLYSCSEVVYDAFAEDAGFVASVEAWEAIRLVANPANLAKYIKFQQQYEEVIFAVLFSALENQKYVELSYSKTLSKATGLYDKILTSDRTSDLLDKTSLDGTEKEELINTAFAFLTKGGDASDQWTAFGEYVDLVNKYASIAEDITEGIVNAANIINSVSMYVSMLDAGVEVLDYLYDLKAYAPNSAFGAAVQTVIDTISNDWVGVVGKTIVEVGFVFGEEAIKKLIDYAWTGCCAMCPFLAGMSIGEAYGTLVCNLYFATEDVIERFEYLKIIDQLENAACALFNQYGNSCKASVNSENSAQLMFATDFSYSLYCLGAEAAIEMMNIGCNKGYVNEVRNFLGGKNKQKFDEFEEAAKECQKIAGISYSQMKNYWKWDIEKDYPQFFSILRSNNITPKYIESITLDKDEATFRVGEIMNFKWSVNPTDYEGEIGLKSDNDAVIQSREPMGILTYALEENIGTANVTIYSIDNPEICDTIKITVIGEDEEGTTEADGKYVTGECGNSLTWTLNKSTGRLTITGGGAMYDYGNYASSYTQYAPWNEYRSCIKSIVIDNSITSIGHLAFNDCDSLISLIIPDSVTTIGSDAFLDCDNLISIKIGKRVTTIGNTAFYGCNCLTSVTMSNNVSIIGTYAFMYCPINNIYYSGTENQWKKISIRSGNESLTKSTIHFNYSPTMHSHSFVSVVTTEPSCVKEGQITFVCKECCTSYNNVIAKKAHTCSNNWQTTKQATCTETGTRVKMCTACGEIIQVERITAAGHTLGEGQIIIAPTTEAEGKVTKRCISCDETIVEKTFAKFTKDIITGKCGESVDWYLNKEKGDLFIVGTGDIYNYDIDYADICKDYSSSVVDLYVCDGVKSIGDYAFYTCQNLVTVNISNSVEIIGKNAFSGCTSLTLIKAGNGLTKIDENAFSGCNKLQKVFLNKNVRNICGWAFYQCESLSEIILPDTLESIGKSAFNYCCKLTEISIPASVTSIGDYAFYNCENLINISVHKDNIIYSSDESGVMFNKNKTILINYPVGSLRKTYSIPETVKSIEYGAFYKGRNLEEISIPHGVERIGACSFADCDSITSLSIPDSVTYIGEEAFYYCDELSEIKIGNGLTIINRYSFAQCHKLVTVEIPVSVKQISYQAFDYSENISDVYYLGTKEQWRDVSIGSGNEYLTNAFIHFKDIISDVPKDPIKDSAVVKNPSTSTISYGDAIILHVDESKIPEGGYVEWTASNGNFSYKADGATCEISPAKSGDTTFTATIYDADGNAVSTDEQTMTAKAGFFDKIIAFFKKLFGLTKTIPNVFKF